MSGPPDRAIVVAAEGLSLAFGGRERSFLALDQLDFEARAGEVTALVGSDGSGKSTLIRVIAGLMAPTAGTLRVLGFEMPRQADEVQARIGYMPQRFGLYEDLTVQENLDLYADLHAVPMEARAQKYPELMDMTALGPFRDRLAGRLSGGMKQKLGLACTLISTPQLLLLDEPTVGVDPLSRRELWAIVRRLTHEQGMPVIVSTSYLDEADRSDHVVVMNAGKELAWGAPAEVRAVAAGRVFRVTAAKDEQTRDLQARLLGEPAVVDAVPEAGRVRVVLSAPEAAAKTFDKRAFDPVEAGFEDGFMTLLRTAAPDDTPISPMEFPGNLTVGTPGAVQVRNLVRKFGAFTAVDNVSFEVAHGEIFGLLGPNGAGKTTTFRMLCGLLPASGGDLTVGGLDMRRAPAEARKRVGYVAQKFSLYGDLSAAENLEFFASVYGLRGAYKRDRIKWALSEFDLAEQAQAPADKLPGGYKQRLAMAAALLHHPEILFLDEPTSGADPFARRDFWRRITAVADEGVAVIVTTHFMSEAEYCDHIAILDSGRILAHGTPAEIRAHGRAEAGREPDMDDAFVAIVEDARAARAVEAAA
jgi:ABC-2 type transport system ATP-binding protein